MGYIDIALVKIRSNRKQTTNKSEKIWKMQDISIQTFSWLYCCLDSGIIGSNAITSARISLRKNVLQNYKILQN